MTEFNSHILDSFNKDLKSLSISIMQMIEIIDNKIVNFQSSIASSDAVRILSTVEGDKSVDRLDHKVNWLCMDILTRRQPMGSDLRIVFASIHISRNLERLDDNLIVVSKIYSNISKSHSKQKDLDTELQKALSYLVEMYSHVNLHNHSIDVSSIEVMLKKDELINNYNIKFVKKCLHAVKDDPLLVDVMNDYIVIARCLERIGDYMMNIYKYLYFINVGQFYQS